MQQLLERLLYIARSESGKAIEAGSVVLVKRIEGVKLFVTPVDVTANV